MDALLAQFKTLELQNPKFMDCAIYFLFVCNSAWIFTFCFMSPKKETLWGF